MASASFLLRSVLLSFPAVATLVAQRVSVYALPKGSAFPAIALFPETGETRDEVPMQSRGMVVQVRADSVVDATAVYEAIRSAVLESDRLVMSGVPVTVCMEGTETYLFDEDLTKYICQFKISMETQQ